MRRMVRDLLRETLPEAIKANGALRTAAEKAVTAASPGGRPAPAAGKPAAAGPAAPDRKATNEAVSLRNDQDLARFVRRLLQLLDDPATRDAVKSGRHQFRLERASGATGPTPSSRPSGAAEKILKGVIKESTVIEAAKAGRRLVIGRGVAVTPLARDKARQLGVQIERDV
jgi:hypothetical protein